MTGIALGVAFGAMSLTATDARADEVSPTGKGIVGGALLGGEVVMITESLFKVESGWAYVIGGGLGAVGGGIGGYFIEQSSTNGKVPVYLLAGGLALIIPTIVLTLNATRYHPSENATEDHAPTNTAPAADPGKIGGSVVSPSPAPAQTPASAAPGPGASPAAPAAPVPPQAPQSLLDVWTSPELSQVRIGVPVPEVRPVYSMAEQKKYGMTAQTELRMPLFRLTF
ncbi:MAG: hypothetical protein ABIP89_02875 [Polyangiaceae bacterium]